MPDYTPIPLKLDGLLAKIETTYGTDVTPTVADNGVRVGDRLWGGNIRVERAFPNLRENVASGDMGPATPALPKGAMASLTIPTNVKGSGAAYSASVRPEADALIQSCGMDATTVTTPGSESVTYKPGNTNRKSCTIWAYAANKLIKVVGCRGTMRWVITAGELSQFVFEMQGIITDTDSEIVEVALPAITYNAQLPPPCVSMGMTVGSWSPQYQSAEAVLNARVGRLDSGNSAQGIREFAISAFEPKVNLVAEVAPKTTYSPYTIVKARTAAGIDWTVGSTQYNRGKLDVNSAWLENDPTAEVHEDFAAWGLIYGCAIANFTILFD